MFEDEYDFSGLSEAQHSLLMLGGGWRKGDRITRTKWLRR